VSHDSSYIGTHGSTSLHVHTGTSLLTHTDVHIVLRTRFYLHARGILRLRMRHDRWIVILMLTLLVLNSHYFVPTHAGELVYNFTRAHECACISQGDHPRGHGNGCNRVYLRVWVQVHAWRMTVQGPAQGRLRGRAQVGWAQGYRYRKTPMPGVGHRGTGIWVGRGPGPTQTPKLNRSLPRLARARAVRRVTVAYR
jgi:hypothetical protein